MAVLTSRHPIVKELLKAFNLPTDQVSAFNLNVLPNEPVTISVQFFVEDKFLGRIPGIVKRYSLTEQEDVKEP